MQYKMKDSGVEWIKSLPVNWEKGRIKYSFYLKGRIGWQGLKSAEFLEDGPFYLITGTDFENGRVIWERCYRIAEDRYNEAPEIHVKNGDLLITKDGTIGKIAYIDSMPQCASLNSHLLIIRPLNKKYSNRYLFWVLLSSVFEMYCGLSQKGSIMASLSQEKMSDFCFPLPPPKEQSAIADYLDEKCGAIDEIIEQAKETIKEYKAWKSSVIFEAVTKGLDPNVEMKDSGVEWIGKMPETWELKPFRYFLHERMEKNSPVKSTERLSLSIELGVTLYSEKTTNLDRFKDDFEQYKLAHEGDLVMNSMNMIVGASGVSKYFGCVSPAYYTFYDKLPDHASAKYCEYVFRSKAMLRILYSLGRGIYAIERGDDRVNTCRLKVPKEDLKALLLPSPSIKEQREIINYLDRKCSAINEIIAEKEALIADMDAYKKSLIFETVTGKRKVC